MQRTKFTSAFDRAFWRAFWATLAFTLAMCALIFQTRDANAQTPDDRNPPMFIVSEWNNANTACAGAQIAPEKNPACKKRDRVARVLDRAGWRQANHGVWYSHQQFNAFTDALLQAQSDIAPALQTGSVYTLVPSAYQRLSRVMNDDQIFAIWNTYSATFKQNAPGGSAIMRQMLQEVERKHRLSNDPRYYIDE